MYYTKSYDTKNYKDKIVIRGTKEELNNIDDRLFKLTKEHDYNEEYMVYVHDTRVYYRGGEEQQTIGCFAIHSNVNKLFNELKEEFNKKDTAKEPTEFKNIDEVVKQFIENNYENIINKWERIAPSSIRDNFNNYKKSKKLLNEDISTRTVNKIMEELGYKKIKSRGKWYYGNIIKKII